MDKIKSFTKYMANQKTILTVVILILLAGNVFFGVKYFTVQEELKETKAAVETQKMNVEILDFTRLFIAKVLKAEKEVDFETRLNLENKVRSLNDEEILTQWQKFTESKTEAEAQENVKNLLELLIKKIRVR